MIWLVNGVPAGPVVPADMDMSRATYLAIGSFSRFTTSPGARSGRTVCAAVCGMIATPKRSSSANVTVRLMPSIAIDPFSATNRIKSYGARTVYTRAMPSVVTDSITPVPSI